MKEEIFMKKVLFKGCGTAIATPFDDKGVNVKEFEKLIEFQIQNDVDSIIVCGTTGEATTMSQQEKDAAIKCAIRTSNGRVPIIVGTGSNSTSQAIQNSKHAKDLGADGILVVTPYYNKCTQKGLIEHFTKIAESVYPLPVIMYSVPSRTGVNILPKTCYVLSKVENIVAIKEASGNLSQIAEIAQLCGDNLNIYSGNDDQILPILSVGGIGVISVLSNIFPKETHAMVTEFLSGNIEKAKSLQLKYIPFIKALFSEVNPIPVKATLNLIGYNFGDPRLPLTPISEENLKIIENELKNL